MGGVVPFVCLSFILLLKNRLLYDILFAFSCFSLVGASVCVGQQSLLFMIFSFARDALVR